MVNTRLKCRWAGYVSGLCLTLILCGCGTTSIAVAPGNALPTNASADARWALLPVLNFSETPKAGEKAESIVGALLPINGIQGVVHYPADDSEFALDADEQRRYERALHWAKQQGYAYGISGSVDEWRYKSGVEGEPAVGLGLRVVDIATGQIVWSAVGSRAGWGRDTVSGTAQVLIADMMQHIRANRVVH
jgi:polysaccharide biosynthesis protein PelC